MNNVRLYHGTDLASANDILQYGLEATVAARYNVTGEFWATTDPTDADWFAKTNPASGIPARLEFEIPRKVLQDLLAHRPVITIAHTEQVHEFLPPRFDVINTSMSNKQIVLVV